MGLLYQDTQFELPHMLVATQPDDRFERHIDAMPPSRFKATAPAHKAHPVQTAPVTVKATNDADGIDPPCTGWWLVLAICIVMGTLALDVLLAAYAPEMMAWVRALLQTIPGVTS